MPVATPFAALGRGNGFPFCLTRVNLDEDWEDNSGNFYAISSTNLMTLAEAARWYWNLYSASASLSASYTDPNPTPDDFSNSASETLTAIANLSPDERVCSGLVISDQYTDFPTDGRAVIELYLELVTNGVMAAYYTTAADSTPVGYGFEPNVEGVIVESAADEGTARLAVGRYYYSALAQASPPSTSSVSIGDTPFLLSQVVLSDYLSQFPQSYLDAFSIPLPAPPTLDFYTYP